jgi:hypothetical protein
MRILAASVLFVAATALPAIAAATPQPLPYSYVYPTLDKGHLEVEQYVDLTPVKALSTSTGLPVFYAATQFQTEFEYGITDRLELGLYLTLAPSPGEDFTSAAKLTEGNGLKERLRLRLAEEGEWPVDVGLYGELVENERELEIEAKILLQRRIGQARVVANLWAERELYLASSQQDWVLNPTLGVTYEVTPAFHPGVEGWMRAEFPDPAPAARTFNLGPAVYVGPTAMIDFGNLWWSTGAYLRATDVGRVLQPGDAFGSVWIRTVVGLSF